MHFVWTQQSLNTVPCFILLSCIQTRFLIFHPLRQRSAKSLALLFYLKLTFSLSACSCLMQVLTALQPHLRNVIEYMLQVNKDTDDEVALEACEFWYVLFWDVIFLIVTSSSFQILLCTQVIPFLCMHMFFVVILNAQSIFHEGVKILLQIWSIFVLFIFSLKLIKQQFQITFVLQFAVVANPMNFSNIQAKQFSRYVYLIYTFV